MKLPWGKGGGVQEGTVQDRKVQAGWDGECGT